MNDFESWWYYEGSAGPGGMDMEEHCKRMCQIAWNNGALKEREACAQVCESMRPTEREFDQRFYTACTLNANAIRDRGTE